MLPIINNIRNETIRNFDGKLLETQFNQYWDCIGRVSCIYYYHNIFWLSRWVFLQSSCLVLYTNIQEQRGGQHVWKWCLDKMGKQNWYDFPPKAVDLMLLLYEFRFQIQV